MFTRKEKACRQQQVLLTGVQWRQVALLLRHLLPFIKIDRKEGRKVQYPFCKIKYLFHSKIIHRLTINTIHFFCGDFLKLEKYSMWRNLNPQSTSFEKNTKKKPIVEFIFSTVRQRG
ncbi:uncharacterized protein LOC127288552 [Leptopilina boulardi]|uniref:uncharacterized protein LOC127288552 n=1 Tax=Leptopilina boulardi TaxID=63433 RepID=UPI0021F587AC|nr:uncharacterized protein LOC127288552 [Leptopilina boulardi]